LNPTVNEYDQEPIPGLPEIPPEGERILWQGAPGWMGLARRAFHVRKVIIYFAVIFVWFLATKLLAGESLVQGVLLGSWLLALALVAIGLLLLLAWANSRATLYTLTNRRVVMRFGVAVSMTINIPFTQIGSAGLRRYEDGTGDITLTLAGRPRVSYLVLWPHVRPWRFGQVEPMLRVVPDAARVADILSGALQALTTPGAEIAPVASPIKEGGADPSAPDLSAVTSA
jgi:hypothetical protein